MLLVLLCVLVFMPGFFSLPVIDRDEARFAQASRQMMESYSLRGWVVPRVQERERLNKPVLIYWLQAVSGGIFSGWNAAHDAIWMYRLPSLLAGIGTVLATWRIGCVLFPGKVGRRTGVLAGALLACAPVFAWEARQARSDQVLVFLTTLAMWAFARIWTGRSRGLSGTALLWVFVGLGVLTKGPITPLVVLLAVGTLAWWGRGTVWARGLIRRLHPGMGGVVVAGLVLPWIVLVVHEVGLHRYLGILADEVLLRGVQAKEGHWGPPGYHAAFGFVLFWPGAMLMGAAIWRAWARSLTVGDSGREKQRESGSHVLRRLRGGVLLRARGKHAGELFCLAWLVPSWIVFELYGTKLPHYTMPLYPALTLLTARCVLAAGGGVVPGLGRGLARIEVHAWALIGLGVMAGAPGLVWVLAGGDLVSGVVSVVANLVVGGLIVVAWRRTGRQRWIEAQVLGIVAAGMGIVALAGFVLPGAHAPWVSLRAADAMLAHDAHGSRPLASVEFHEDSLIFHTRGRIERIDADQLGTWLDAHMDGLVLMAGELAAEREDLRVLDEIEGFNYSNGRRVRLVVAERSDAGSSSSRIRMSRQRTSSGSARGPTP